MVERRKQGGDLTGRRGGYDTLKKDLHRFFKRMWVVVVVIGVVCTVALAGFGYFLRKLDQDALHACQSQNSRHDNTVSALIFGSNQDQLHAKTEEAREEIRGRRDVTITLIDAIAPKTDCSNPIRVETRPTITPIPEEVP